MPVCKITPEQCVKARLLWIEGYTIRSIIGVLGLPYTARANNLYKHVNGHCKCKQVGLRCPACGHDLVVTWLDE